MVNPFKTIIIVLVVVIVGAGIALAAGVWDPSWNPFTPTLTAPEAVMQKMVQKMAEVKSLSSEGKIYIDVIDEKDQEQFKLLIAFSGDAEDLDQDHPKLAMGFDIGVTMEGMTFSVDGKIKSVEEEVYSRLDTIPAPLHPFFLFAGVKVEEIRGQWIKFEPKEEEKEQLEEIEEIADKLKELLSKRAPDLLKIKEVLSEAEIKGVATHHYLVALDKEGLKQFIPELVEILEEEEPGELFGAIGARGRAQEARLMANLAQMRAMAEIIYGREDYSYLNLSCDHEDVSRLCQDIVDFTGEEPTIFTSHNEYCLYGSMPVEGYYYCLDSRSSFGTTNVFPGGSGYCTGTTFVCSEQASIPPEKWAEAGKNEYLQELDEFLEKMKEITFELWIGKRDFYLYRIKFDQIIDIAEFIPEEFLLEKPEERLKLVLGFDVYYSNFNQPLKIEPPEEYKTLEEIFSPMIIEEPPVIKPEIDYEYSELMPSAPESPAALLQNLPQLLRASLFGIPF